MRCTGKAPLCRSGSVPEHKSHNIAVVTTYLSDYIFPRVIQGIDDVLTAEGYSILLKNTRQFQKPGSTDVSKSCCRRTSTESSSNPVKARSAAGICIYMNSSKDYGIPYVFIQGCFDRMEDRPQVLMDDCRGGSYDHKVSVRQWAPQYCRNLQGG